MNENSKKIFHSIQALNEFIATERKTYDWDINVGLASGCYDVLHSGHSNLLDQASKRCDLLVAGVTPDAAVSLRKGEGRPIFSQRERAEALASLPSVDAVLCIDDSETDILKIWSKVVEQIKPQILFSGEERSLKQEDLPRGTEIRVLNSNSTLSTSKIENAIIQANEKTKLLIL